MQDSLTRNLRFISHIAIISVAFILGTYFLKEISTIAIAVTVGIILGLAFAPLVKFLQRRLRFPIIFALLISVLFFIAISIGFLAMLYSSLSSITESFAFYREKISNILSSLSVFYGRLGYFDSAFIEELQTEFFSFVRSSLFSLSRSILSISTTYILITLILIFTILEYLWIGEKVKTLYPDKAHEKRFETMLAEINANISKFVILKALISMGTGLIIFITFVLVGVDFPLFWAIITFLFNFIPSVGSLIISVVSILFCLLQFYPSWSEVIIVAVIILATQNIIGNIIDPSIMGDMLNLSPLIILLGLIYWSHVWGVMGMLLTVPLLVTIRIAFQYVPYLRKVAVLLGNGAIIAKMNRKTEHEKKTLE